MSTIENAIDAFLSALNTLDGKSRLPADLLQRCLTEENNIRRLFARSPTDPLLTDPYIGLVDIFSTLSTYASGETGQSFLNLLRSRTHEDFADPTFSPRTNRLFVNNSLHIGEAFVPNIATFKRNWDAFTHGIFTNFNWSGVVAAGGAVQACMLPFPDPKLGTDELTAAYDINTHYQTLYPTSDVDLFLCGSIQEATLLVLQITTSIRRFVRYNIVYVRKANTISIHTLFPYRPLQIVLRLYRSPAEILAGFDIDAACFAFDGENVWTNPRGIAACIRKCNTVDLTRRSPSYESRLSKYARRGYEVVLPSLQRTRIDDVMIYNRDMRTFPNGLARLLVLEKMNEDSGFYRFLPPKKFRYGEPTDGRLIVLRRLPLEDQLLEENNYDLVWTGVPYGLAWDAKNIGNLIQKIDETMNEPERLARDGHCLHRHAVVASETLSELLNGTFCQHCPSPSFFYNGGAEIDKNKYVYGPIQFIQENAGRQLLSGSFNPIDLDDWTDDAYLPVGGISGENV